ncbi:MAG: ABC transporter substrate-binding protein [Candidatus Rokubacteria bacterium]|nr:ABC transporter substrate-binding protein [Candidatus Rokubacteria bacterium]
MRRAIVVSLLALALGLLAAPLAADAQHAGKVLRIGRLSPLSASADASIFLGFRQGLHELGWVEGKHFTVESRFAEGRLDRLPELAADLVRLKVDVIVSGSTPGALAAKHATSTIPIVMVTTGDPVASGLVVSLARPGGNLTGMTALGQELTGKRLQLFKEALPSVSRVAVLSDPAYPDSGPTVKGAMAAARALGVRLRVFEIRDPAGFEEAFRGIVSDRTGGLLVSDDPLFNTHRRRIVERAIKSRLPTMCALLECVDVGGLIFYGASLPDMYRRAATYVDKILKGTKPEDLPVEQPTKFELVINLKTAKALGLTIPQAVLIRADRVVQ